MKIGCNLNYRLNMSSLSSARKAKVNNYVSYIDKCNSLNNESLVATSIINIRVQLIIIIGLEIYIIQ